jgi:hypothetical protein
MVLLLAGVMVAVNAFGKASHGLHGPPAAVGADD